MCQLNFLRPGDQAEGASASRREPACSAPKPERKRKRCPGATSDAAARPLTTRMTVAVQGSTMVVAFSSPEGRPIPAQVACPGFSERAREIQGQILRRGVDQLVLTGRGFGGALAEIAHLQLRTSGDPASPWHPLSQMQRANRLHVHTVAFAGGNEGAGEAERICSGAASASGRGGNGGDSDGEMQALLASSCGVVDLFDSIVGAVTDARKRSGGWVDRGRLKEFLRRLARSSAAASDLAFYRRDGKILFCKVI